jgi:probable phosphoglycerate mutase
MRHAQSWWQVDPSHDWDTSLTDLGHEQARRTAAWLASDGQVDRDSKVEVGSLYSSPLQRAHETARYTAAALGIELRVEEQLREATFHVASELPRSPRPQQRPTGPPTERYLAFRAQVESGWQKLVATAEADSTPVLAVCHGGFIKTLFRIIGGSNEFCVTLYNACLSLMEWRRGRWHIVYINLWDHLPPQLRTT